MGDWGPSNRAGHRALRVIGPNSAFVLCVVHFLLMTAVDVKEGLETGRPGFGESPKAVPPPPPATASRCKHSKLCLCTKYLIPKNKTPHGSNTGAKLANTTVHANTVALKACWPGRSNTGFRADHARLASLGFGEGARK